MRSEMIHISMIVTICCLISTVFAIGDYQYNIPNGFNVPCPPGSCFGMCAGVGHLNNDQKTAGCSGGEHPYHYNNQFGLDLEKYAAFLWNVSICVVDSDGDGQTNGDELGDPCCTWTKDNPMPIRPRGSVSHPGFANSKVNFKSCLLDGAPTMRLVNQFLSQTLITVQLDFNNSCSCNTQWNLKVGNSSTSRAIDVLVQNGNNFTLSALDPGVEYAFSLVSSNLKGTTQLEFNLTTPALLADAPNAPQNISLVSASSTSLLLSWPAVAGSTSYQLDVAAGPAGNSSMFTTVYVGSAANYQLTNLSVSETYQFRVRSVNANGVGQASSTFSFLTTAGGVPSSSGGDTPSGIQVESKGYKVTMDADDTVKAGSQTTLGFSITDPTGTQLAFNSLTLDRNRRLHVFLLSEDLDVIARVAPEDFPANNNLLSYYVSFTPSKWGSYQVVASFSHNGNNVSAVFPLTVSSANGGGLKVGTAPTDFTKFHIMMGNGLNSYDTYTPSYRISIEDMTAMGGMTGAINASIFGTDALTTEGCQQIFFEFQDAALTAFLGNAIQVLVFHENFTDFSFLPGNDVASLTTTGECGAQIPASMGTFGPYVNVPIKFNLGGSYWLFPFWVVNNDTFFIGRFEVNVTDNSLPPLTSTEIQDGDFEHHVSVLSGQMDIYWTINGQVLTMALVAQGQGWLGVGFNPGDGGMTDADMIMGWIDASSGIQVVDYWSTGEVAPTPDNLMESPNGTVGTSDILAMNGTKSGTSVTIKFRRPLNTGDIFDSVLSSGPMTLVYAFNPTTNQLSTHGPNLRGSATVDLFSGNVEGIDSGLDAIQAMRLAHAILMVLGWMIFVPAGIIIARFFHHYKWWFPVHIAVMTCAVTMIIIAFVIGIVMTNDTQFLQSSVLARSHSWLGLIVVVMGICQPILGYIADKMYNPDRTFVPWFPDKLHWYFGRYSALGAYVNVLLGMIYLDVWLGYWIMFGVLILLQIVGVHFAMQWKKKTHAKKVIVAENVENSQNSQQFNSQSSQGKPSLYAHSSTELVTVHHG